MSGADALGYSRRRPFAATRVSSVRLTPAGAPKDTRHHVISLAESGLSYRPGDAIGVFPRNQQALVDAILLRLGATGDELVTTPDPTVAAQDTTLTLREALSSRCDLTIPGRRLLEACLARGAEKFRLLLAKGADEQLKHYLHGRDAAHDVLDVLQDAPSVQFAAAEFVALLRTLQPRLYSLASSARVHPREAHLLVISLTYVVRGRVRLGVGSTFINERWPLGATAPVFLQDAQRHFGMPPDPATPMIMIGPGTGLAPFRAFLEEREAAGASGRNWLFFGEQSRAWGYYYEAELTAWAARGLVRLDLAFSRDQPQKIYVQHRMRENAAAFYAWLEEGAEVFICGDKERMAADVQTEIARIVETEGGRTPEQAIEYVAALRKTRRLKLDVY